MTSHDIDETDGQPRAFEYEAGDEGQIGGDLIVVAILWGLIGWAWVGAFVALLGMLS